MPSQIPTTDLHVKSLLRWSAIWMGGDFGPWTVWTTARRKRVFVPRSPPTTGPSPAQLRCRQRFALAIRRFKLLAPADQEAWEAAAQKTRLVATGLDVWIHLALTIDRDSFNGWQQTHGLTLTPPDYIPR